MVTTTRVYACVCVCVSMCAYMCVHVCVPVYDFEEILTWRTTLFYSGRRQLLRSYALISWCQALATTWHTITQHINKDNKGKSKGRHVPHAYSHVVLMKERDRVRENLLPSYWQSIGLPGISKNYKKKSQRWETALWALGWTPHMWIVCRVFCMCDPGRTVFFPRDDTPFLGWTCQRSRASCLLSALWQWCYSTLSFSH